MGGCMLHTSTSPTEVDSTRPFFVHLVLLFALHLNFRFGLSREEAKQTFKKLLMIITHIPIED